MTLKKIADSIKKSSYAVIIGAVLFVLSSLITISNGGAVLKDYYYSTVGYKRNLVSKISDLEAGIHIDNFINTFGTPKFVNGNGGINEYVFVNENFYLQAITNYNGTVIAYSITTREKNFNPEITLGPYTSENISKKIILGKTKYFELNVFGEPEIFSYIGAHDYHYSEGYYFGNPGFYQTFFFSTNQSGYNENIYLELLPLDSSDAIISNSKIQDFRFKQPINTYTVTAPGVNRNDLNLKGYIFKYGFDNNNGFLLGPYYNQVRVLD